MPGVFRGASEPVAILAAGVVTPIGGDPRRLLDRVAHGRESDLRRSSGSRSAIFASSEGGEIRSCRQRRERPAGCRASRLLCAAG